MKKIIAIFMMLIFMLSVTAGVYADREGEKATIKDVSSESPTQSRNTNKPDSATSSENLINPTVACESFTISNCPGFCKTVCLPPEGCNPELEICPSVCADVRGSCVEKDEPSKRPRPLSKPVKSVTKPIQQRPDSFEVKIRDSFDLGGLKVTFLDVLEDSRCPANADCISEGDVTILINVQIDGEDKGDHKLTKRVQVGKYSIGLEFLAPYPGTTEDSNEEYVATLKVGKSQLVGTTGPIKITKAVTKLRDQGLTDDEIKEKLVSRSVEARERNLVRFTEHKDEMVTRLTEQGFTQEEIEDRFSKREEAVTQSLDRRVVHIEKVTDTILSIEDLGQEEIRKIKNLNRAQVKRVLTADNPTEALETIKPVKLKIRDVSIEKKDKLKNVFNEHRIAFEEQKGVFKVRKDEFRDARDELRECDADCEAKEQEVLEKAKEFVVNRGEALTSYLEKLIAKVQGSEQLTENQADTMVADLKDTLGRVDAEIEKAQNAQNKKELKEAAKEISAIWGKVKHFTQRVTQRLINGRLHSLIVRSDQLEKKLDRVLEQIESKGIVISDLDAKVDAFSEFIENAKVFYEKSEVKLDEAKNSDDRDERNRLIKEAKSLAKQGQDALKSAHEILVELIRQIKSVDANADLEV